MKKGFTLIELLAVIVILAIIAVIAVPIVLNIIDETKSNATLRSADFYLDAVEYTISNAYLYHGGLQDGDYPITPEGNLCKTALPCSEENTLKVEVNGEVPKSGTITITNGNISGIELEYEEKTIVKNSDGDLTFVVPVCSINRKDPNKYSIGDEVICELTESMDKFYIIEEQPLTATQISMLTEKHIHTTQYRQSDNAGTIAFSNSVYWQNYEKTEYTCYGNGGCPEGEKYYESPNIYDENSLVKPIVDNYTTYLNKTLTGSNGSLLTMSQLSKLGCWYDYDCDDGSCNSTSWIITSGEYWTGAGLVNSYYGDAIFTISPRSDGVTEHNNCFFYENYNNSFGVRPVITISTSYIK